MIKETRISLCLIYFIFANYNIIISQDRINTSPASCIMEGEKISSATGWCKNYSNGQWFQNENTVRGGATNRDNLNWGDFENFIYFKLCKGSLEGKDYYFLIKQSISIDFKYQTIKEGKYYFCETSCTVITPGQFKNLKNASKKDSKAPTIVEELPTISIRSSYKDNKQEYEFDEKELMLEVAKKNENKFLTAERRNMGIQKTTSDGKEVIRFTIAGIYGKSSWERQYYELPAEEFIKVFPKE